MIVKRRLPAATLEEAEALTAAIDNQIQGVERAWHRIGTLVVDAVERQVPKAYGLNMRQWLLQKFRKRSAESCLRYLRIMRALEGVPDEKLRLTEGNAFTLTHLPEKERKSEEWLEKAATLPNKVFQEEVAASREQRTGEPRPRFRGWSIALPEDVYEEMQAAEQKIARMQSLDLMTYPGHRITVWSMIASLINTTDESRLQVEMEGDVEGATVKSHSSGG